jgi:anti-sigma factor (TIGR02949 family)
VICDEIRRLAYFYLDGTVSSAKAASLESHVVHCPECGARLAINRRVREVVQLSLRPLQAPERLRVRVQKVCRGCE